MSRPEVRKALEVRLNALTPALATAWENARYEPQIGTPYQRVTLLPGVPENPTRGPFVRELGLLQVSLFYPLDKGPAAAEARAKLIKDWFPRALTLTNGGIITIISNTPYNMSGSIDEDWWMLPVRIPYYANIP